MAIPHPILPLSGIRITDIQLLLLVGAIWELLVRCVMLLIKRKPKSIRAREGKLMALEKQIIKSRALGPQAFVETSKLERQQLAEQKALAASSEQRKGRVEQFGKLTRNMDVALCVLIVVLFYGIPLMEFTGDKLVLSSMDAAPTRILTQEQAEEKAIEAFRAFMFPITYLGFGVRISRWGLLKPQSSMGALIVFWSSQTLVSKLMDGVDALLV